jgi:hypothetical protein
VAERLALNQVGEGSSPSGPTRIEDGSRCDALVVQRRGHRTRNAATWVRVPPGALGLLDNSDALNGAHDVAAAYRLAMADVRVRLPLGTLSVVRDPGCGKAWPNPPASGAGNRRFESGHPDWIVCEISIPVWPNGKAAPC